MNEDPYVIPGTFVLKNRLGLTDMRSLQVAESERVAIWSRFLRIAPLDGNYDTNHLKSFHRFLFKDIYDWAGEFRTVNIFKPEPILGGKATIEYCNHQDIKPELDRELDSFSSVNFLALAPDRQAEVFAGHLARIWKIHPFREGNTRTAVLYSLQFADSQGIRIRTQPFFSGSQFLRGALVAASAYYSDPRIGDKSRPEYLVRFVRDSMVFPQQGIRDRIAAARAQKEGYTAEREWDR